MGSYIDPIVYYIQFACIADREQDHAIKAAFQRIVHSVKPALIPFMCADRYFCSYNYGSGQDAFPPATVTFIGSSYHTEEQTEDELDSIVDILLQEETFHFVLQLGTGKELGRYGKSANRYAKEYGKWLGVRTPPADEFINHSASICDLLNCPSDDLEDVRLPNGTMANREPFEITLGQRPVASIVHHEYDPWRYDIVAETNGTLSGKYLFELCVSLPRAAFREFFQTMDLQKQWYEELMKLGAAYDCCFGTMGMDTPLNSKFGHGTWYDSETTRVLKKRFFSGFIPGYSWCTLINRSQSSLISMEGTDKIFHRIRKMENGNVCFQLTPDMRYVSREVARKERNYFRPYLPPVALSFNKYFSPLSLRLGFLPEEMHFLGGDLYLFDVAGKPLMP